MDVQNYKDQLNQIKILLINCPDEQKKDLISLKNAIEELLHLTDEKQTTNNFEDVESIIDAEYAKFMTEITENNDLNTEHLQEQNGNSGDLNNLEGQKCRAPYEEKWGVVSYHNAMICSVVPNNNYENIMVKILYMNPTNVNMLPCPYFFDGDCKFSADKCKYSHGETVPLNKLKDYAEPDFTSIQVGHTVLAKQSNNIWCRGKICQILDGNCAIKYESQKKSVELPFDHLLPLFDQRNSASSENSSDDEDKVNLSLINSLSSTALGNWEQYTSKIGSKLMLKMGYVYGTGLGKRSDGRIEPVPAIILPPGKSLDHCMKLKEKFGNKNLFLADKQLESLQKKEERQLKRLEEKECQNRNVFNCINEACSSVKNNAFDEASHRNFIKKEPTRSLNVTSIEIDKNIQYLKVEIRKLQDSISRHSDGNRSKLKAQMQFKTKELLELEKKARNIDNEKALRDTQIGRAHV